MFRVDVITLFPQIFEGYMTQSLLAKAISNKLVELHIHNLRDWSLDPKHHKIDDRPYGGGPGMLICVEPVIRCVEAVQSMESTPGQVILLTPQGEQLRQQRVENLAQSGRLL